MVNAENNFEYSFDLDLVLIIPKKEQVWAISEYSRAYVIEEIRK